MLVDGNVGMKFRRESLEKAVVEVIKTQDSDNHSKECIYHKHGEQWELINIDLRFFSQSANQA